MRKLLVFAALGIGLALLAPARPAAAHPLGDFSVNQFEALDLYPDRVEVAAVVDLAELPTLQDRSTVDTDGDGAAGEAELRAHADRDCAALARDFEMSVGPDRLKWTVTERAFEYAPGAAGLSTSRLTCRLTAGAALAGPATVELNNRFRTDRVGWREITAVGHGVRPIDSPLPERSVSDGLRSYPQDLLTSPLDVRAARLRTEPGDGATVASTAPRAAPARAGWTGGMELTLRDMVADRSLTPLVGLLAVLLALLLGAAHAALPGHGKTVMAAYLAGKQGRVRDAVAVGATVTASHTGGVLVLGLLLTSVAGLVGETVLGWLGLVSGGIVAAVGVGMLISARRRRQQNHGDHGDGGDGHGDHGHGGHGHGGHGHGGPGHGHGHGDHGHHHAPSRFGILGIGLAGGLVPSPSALVILLGAIGLGRTGFGVLLVVAYGLGMAAVLTAAGFVLIGLQRRWRRRPPSWSGAFARVSRLAPTATAALVLLVGMGLAGRALIAL